tara:strand:- start:227 stop:787 length:561 start_codon:yes stop_codon:yes gene_type:complete
MFIIEILNTSFEKINTHSKHNTLKEAQKVFIELAKELDSFCEIPKEIGNWTDVTCKDKVVRIIHDNRPEELKGKDPDFKNTRLIGVFNGAFAWRVEVDQTEEAQTKKVKAGPKRLKPVTLKKYSAEQLAKHLDRLQDHFVDAPYRVSFGYLEVRKYDKDDNCYYFYGISKESILEAVNDSYRLLGI